MQISFYWNLIEHLVLRYSEESDTIAGQKQNPFCRNANETVLKSRQPIILYPRINRFQRT